MIRELEFQVLSQRHCDEIYRYALGLLGSPADAEDATQETLLKLWNHLPRLNLFHIRAWLFRITRNYCLDEIRQRSRVANRNSDEDEYFEEWPDDLAVDPSFAADA